MPSNVTLDFTASVVFVTDDDIMGGENYQYATQTLDFSDPNANNPLTGADNRLVLDGQTLDNTGTVSTELDGVTTITVQTLDNAGCIENSGSNTSTINAGDFENTDTVVVADSTVRSMPIPPAAAAPYGTT